MTDGLRELMDRMNSRRLAVRREAVRQALALPPERLFELVEIEARRYPYRLQRFSRVLLWGLCILALTPCIVNWIRLQNQLSCGILAFVTLACLALTAGIESFHRFQARFELAEVMLRRADLELLVPAVEMLQIRPANRKEQALRRTLHGMLKHSLSKLHASDAADMSRIQRDAINRLLRNPLEDMDLTLCVLTALEQVGDATALPAVQRLCKLAVPLRWRRPGKRHKAAQVAEIRAAAAECLPFLTARIEQTQQAQTLLRASEAQAQAPETLLRPTTSRQYETSLEQLLHPQSPN
jgi:hypothetical protein